MQQTEPALSLFIPPTYHLFGLRLTDVAIAGLAIILALFVTLIVYLIITGSGERPLPWHRRRHRHHHHRNNEIGG